MGKENCHLNNRKVGEPIIRKSTSAINTNFRNLKND